MLRLNLLSQWCPELALPPISDEDRRHLVEQVCHGVFTGKELKKTKNNLATLAGSWHVSCGTGSENKILKAWCQIWVLGLLEIAAEALRWRPYQEGLSCILLEARPKLRRLLNSSASPSLQNET